MKRITRIVAAAATASATAAFLSLSTPVGAQPQTSSLDALAIAGGPIVAKVHPSLDPLRTSSNRVTVSVRLTDPSLAEAVGVDAKQVGAKLSRSAQRNHVNGLKAKQRELLGRITALGGKQLTSTQKALNSVVVDVAGTSIDEVAHLPGVMSVTPVVDRELDLSDTVPYIGAAALHARTPGITGAGVDVAVLDSGIDYTHARFGGAGTVAAYTAAYGTSTADARNKTLDGLFPTAKVIGGFDFVGEAWPGTPTAPAPEAPDPDPIDCGPSAVSCAGGHGSHVASIIAGNNGVAPDAKIYAFKVCSAVSTSCSGVALLQGMDAALDPNGDGDISDSVDVINMSLGSPYGQIQDDLSAASAHAVRMGVVVVASAGNSADKPYITGSPAATPEVISVAQTQVPSALGYVLRITQPASVAGIYKNTATVDWAPITTGFSGDIKYGAPGAERLGCFDAGGAVSPYPAGFFAGMVALIDRGVCAVSIKVDHAADAGAVGVVIANNVGGAAPSFSFGGPATFDPAQTIIVGLEVGNAIRTGLLSGTTSVSVNPADATPLVGSMVSTSSRGPNMSFNAIKPDIGAPGASLSAEAGTGTGETAFGGTSGAAPMVTGSVALLLQARPTLSTDEVKALLMNTGDTNVLINPVTQPGVLAEITRIGGGEVRADKAVDSQTAAWDRRAHSAGLSFGYVALDVDRTLTKQVTVRNYSNSSRTYTITPSFRYANDAASGAVTVSAPATITVPSTGTGTFTVSLSIDVEKLPDWVLDGGLNGNNGGLLATNEFDGYVTLSGGGDSVHLPWHVLPHRAANVQAPEKVKLAGGTGTMTLTNPAASGQVGTAEVFALTGKSDRIPPSMLPGPGDNFAVIDLSAVGVRQISGALQFGVTTFGQRAHPDYPARFDVLIDNNRDGTVDFVIFNRDAAGAGGTDGRNLVWVQQIGSTTASAFFFTDADLNSANAILTAPLAAVGLTPGTQFDFTVLARDHYFFGGAGVVTDSIEGMTFTAGTPKFAASADTIPVPAGGSASVGVTEVPGGGTASPSQFGFLLLMRDAEFNEEANLVRVS